MKRKRGRPRKSQDLRQEEDKYVVELDLPFDFIQSCGWLQDNEQKDFQALVNRSKCGDIAIHVAREDDRLKLNLQGMDDFPIALIEDKWQCVVKSVFLPRDDQGQAEVVSDSVESPSEQKKQRRDERSSTAADPQDVSLSQAASAVKSASDTKSDDTKTDVQVLRGLGEPPATQQDLVNIETVPRKSARILVVQKDDVSKKERSPIKNIVKTLVIPKKEPSSSESTPRKSARISAVVTKQERSPSTKSQPDSGTITTPGESLTELKIQEVQTTPETATENVEAILPESPQVELVGTEISDDLKELIQEAMIDFEQNESRKGDEQLITELDGERLVIVEEQIKDEPDELNMSSRSRRIRRPKRFDGEEIVLSSVKRKRKEMQTANSDVPTLDRIEAELIGNEEPGPQPSEVGLREPEMFICDKCPLEVSTMLELIEHKVKVHNEMPKKKRGRKPKALKVESASDDPGASQKPKEIRTIKCPGCDTTFTERKSALKHVKAQHSDSTAVLLEMDRLVYNTYKCFRKTGEQVVALPCGICQEVRTGRSIFHHLETCHSGEETYDSILAETKTKYGEGYKNSRKICKKTYEERVRKKGLVYMCQYCGKQFDFRPTRTNHENFRCAHNPNRRKLTECYVCGFATPNKEKYHEHMKKHEGFESHKCELCEKSYKTRAGLIVHNRKTHKIAKKHPIVMHTCHICERSFYDKDHLRIHLAIHSDARQYQCELCGSQYKSAAQVQKHQKMVHYNRYAFHCEKCGHGVEKKSYLKMHKCGRVRRIQAQEKTLLDPMKPKAKRDRAQKTLKNKHMGIIQIVQPRQGSSAPTYISNAIKHDPDQERPTHVMLEFHADGQPQTSEAVAVNFGDYYGTSALQQATTDFHAYPEPVHVVESAQQVVDNSQHSIMSADGQTILKVIQPGIDSGLYGQSMHLVPTSLPVGSELMTLDTKPLGEEVYQQSDEMQNLHVEFVDNVPIEDELKQEGDVAEDATQIPKDETQLQETGIEMHGVPIHEAQVQLQERHLQEISGGHMEGVQIHEVQMDGIQMHENQMEGVQIHQVQMEDQVLDGQAEETQIQELHSQDAQIQMEVSDPGIEITSGEVLSAQEVIQEGAIHDSQLTEIIEVPGDFATDERYVSLMQSDSNAPVPVSHITLEELHRLGFSLQSVSEDESTYTYQPVPSGSTVMADSVAAEEIVVESAPDYDEARGQVDAEES